jgi:NAD(P)-dependent dehydrogenase (short-subunit alcohol dehydrogenase family)
MARQLEGKVALVTGGAAGIGRAAALAFAENGAFVAINDLKTDRGEEIARLIEEGGGKALFIPGDVSSSADVDRLIQDTVEKFGSLDCAFNNAGIEGEAAPTAECTEENFDRTIAINLRGVWLSMRRELRQMLEQGTGGTIVNMASVAGLVGFRDLPAYVASKHGVLGLTKTAALEYATAGIRVNAVCPGVIHTEMIDRITGLDPEKEKQFTDLEPIGRMGTPEEIAAAAVWLCTGGASFVTGHSLTVDGGLVAQ